MRTRLTIDDDVFAAARQYAQRGHKTLGGVVSALARQGLERAARGGGGGGPRNGVPLLAVRHGASPVTLGVVNQLRDEAP